MSETVEVEVQTDLEVHPVTPEDFPPIVLDVRGLSKKYKLATSGSSGKKGKKQEKEFWALKDISFTVRAGERVGIMGHNGAGKSTLLKILSRVSTPTEGEAFIKGRTTSLLEVGTGINPKLTGRQNIFLNASLHGLSRAEVMPRIDAIIEFSELGRFIDQPVQTYSTGMRSRLGFSVAAHLDPDLLMLDEVLSVGDAAFQQKCLTRMDDLTGHGRTVLFVSHSTGSVRRFCDRCIWLNHGEIVMDGPAQDVCEAYEAQMLDVSATYQAAAKTAGPKAKATPSKPVQVEDSPNSDGVLSEIEEGAAAELVSAQVLDMKGNPARSIKINEDCEVEMIYDVLKPDLRVEPALHFKNKMNEILFVTAFTDEDFPDAINKPGRYKSVIHLPGNLLNEGLHFVTLCLVTADPLVRHQIVDNAVSFSVYELQGDMTLSSRGRYARSFPGGLRPRLNWDTKTVKQ